MAVFQKTFEKKNVYNLNEEEDLTHYGHSLADIEKLNDMVDSDSDTEEKGMLSGGEKIIGVDCTFFITCNCDLIRPLTILVYCK